MRFLLMFAMLAACVLACGCAGLGGPPGSAWALTLHEPVSFGYESKPDPLRVTPSYSAPSWSAPQPSGYVAPSAAYIAPGYPYAAPGAAPCGQ